MNLSPQCCTLKAPFLGSSLSKRKHCTAEKCSDCANPPTNLPVPKRGWGGGWLIRRWLSLWSKPVKFPPWKASRWQDVPVYTELWLTSDSQGSASGMRARWASRRATAPAARTLKRQKLSLSSKILTYLIHIIYQIVGITDIWPKGHFKFISWAIPLQNRWNEKCQVHRQS